MTLLTSAGELRIGDHMTVEYIRYYLPKDQRDSFLSAYKQAEISLKNSPHCLGYELSECVEERGRFILRIEWDSMEGHVNGFRKSSAFTSFFAAVKPCISFIEEMQHYAVTQVASHQTV